jgi:hypothetical protein
MISITDAVRQDLVHNPLIMEFLNEGLLNTSEYARKIQNKIQENCFKKVEINSIVTSLSRLKQNPISISELTKLQISDIQTKYPIADLLYLKDTDSATKIGKLYSLLQTENRNHFLNIIAGVTEINIFASSELMNDIFEIFGEKKLKYKRDELTAITVKLAKDYIDALGITYQLLRSLVLENVNVVETVTTFSEVTIFVDKINTQKTIEILSKNFLSR